MWRRLLVYPLLLSLLAAVAPAALLTQSPDPALSLGLVASASHQVATTTTQQAVMIVAAVDDAPLLDIEPQTSHQPFSPAVQLCRAGAPDATAIESAPLSGTGISLPLLC
jgi:hypothetical protein